jgi:hypothetical protein
MPDFPKRYTKSSLGLKLSAKELADRTAGLDAWMTSLIARIDGMSSEAQMSFQAFLGGRLTIAMDPQKVAAAEEEDLHEVNEVISSTPDVVTATTSEMAASEVAEMSVKSISPCRFGIISTASIAAKTLPGMTKVVAVASRDVAKAEEFIAKNAKLTKEGFAGEGMTYDELVSHRDVEAVYCPLPTGLRNEWIRKAVAAGKHVYSEKPMGGTVAELKAIIDECEAKNVQFMDGTMWYHSKRTHEIEKILASGELGPLRTVSAAFTFHFPDQAWLDGGNGRTDKSREPMGCLGDQVRILSVALSGEICAPTPFLHVLAYPLAYLNSTAELLMT